MRLFIGVALPDDIKDSIGRFSTRLERISSGRYVSNDMYHITLAYIGESDDRMLDKAQEALRLCAHTFQPVRLVTSVQSYFGRRDKAILHLTVENGEALMPVCATLRRLLDERSLPYDPKPLVPHITLARNVNVSDALLDAAYTPVHFTASGLTLFNSCRIDGVLKYIPVAHAGFENGGAANAT